MSNKGKSFVSIKTIFIILITILMSLPVASAEKKIDRDDLKGYMTKYLDALVAHKPDSLPVSENVKFTEDCKEIKFGEGLWKSDIKLTDYRRDILDVRDGNAVSFTVIEEKGATVFYVIRLKIVDEKITEIETTVVRGQAEGMLFDPTNLKTVSEGMAYIPKKEQLNSREEMVKMAITYPEGLKVGSFVKVDSPMAEKAYRYENGQLMAGPGCTFFPGCDNMKTQTIPTLSEITYRTIAVDEEMGVVAMRMNFGRGSTFSGNNELDVWHSFKIYDGLIHAAEAYCEQVPMNSKYGWE